MTEAGQREAFLRAICEDPKDDAPRLMYADWLDEHGESERAEFIRVGCEAAGLAPCEAECRNRIDYQCRICRLRRLERELWRGTGKPLHYPCQWFEVPNWACLADIGLTRIEWTTEDDDEIVGDIRRGFVAVVTLPSDVWLRHADALCAACPLEEVRLVDKEPYHNAAGKWIWSRFGVFRDVHVAHTLPSELFELLTGGRDPMTWNSVRYYDTEGQANADLSRACVAYSRERVGLPPLEDRHD